VQRQLWFSSFHLSPGHLPAYVGEIRRRGLRFLEGYPSTLFIVARYLQDVGEVLPMKAVFTSSETLHDVQRSTIEAAFEAPIFDFFGHAERTIFATECEAHEGKHIAEDYGWVEVVDGAGNPVPDGDPGYLVGTSLHNRAMPMIRYRTSDVSRVLAGTCSCGRTHRRIESVTTKAEDIVITPDGRMISPSILTHPFKPFESLRASQIVQESIDHLRILLVPSERFGEEDQATLRASLIERLGEGMSVEFEIVDEIPRERSGKFRWVISQVDHATHFAWSESSGSGAS
jgi:phenylacetate-CoA ligase